MPLCSTSRPGASPSSTAHQVSGHLCRSPPPQLPLPQASALTRYPSPVPPHQVGPSACWTGRSPGRSSRLVHRTLLTRLSHFYVVDAPQAHALSEQNRARSEAGPPLCSSSGARKPFLLMSPSDTSPQCPCLALCVLTVHPVQAGAVGLFPPQHPAPGCCSATPAVSMNHKTPKPITLQATEGCFSFGGGA